MGVEDLGWGWGVGVGVGVGVRHKLTQCSN